MSLKDIAIYLLLTSPLWIWNFFFKSIEHGHLFNLFWHVQIVVFSIVVLKTMDKRGTLSLMNILPLPISFFGLVSFGIDNVEYSDSNYLLFLGIKFILTISVNILVLKFLIKSGNKWTLYFIVATTALCTFFKIDILFDSDFLNYVYTFWFFNWIPPMISYFLFFRYVNTVLEEKTSILRTIMESILFPLGFLFNIKKVRLILRG